MLNRLSQALDWLSNFLAARKGLLPVIGMILVLLNFILSLVSQGWVVESSLFLHLGIIIAIFGLMLAWAL